MRILFSLLLLVGLAACSNGGSPTGAINTGVINIAGTIQGWNPSLGSQLEAVTLTSEVVGSGAIAASGDFSVQANPPQSYRETPIGGCTSTLGPDVVVTPSTLRMNNVTLQVAGSGGFITLSNAPTGTRVVTYLYANESGTVAGSDLCSVEYYYNMTLQPGWNVVFADFVRESGGRPTSISYRSYPPDTDISGLNYYASN